VFLLIRVKLFVDLIKSISLLLHCGCTEGHKQRPQTSRRLFAALLCMSVMYYSFLLCMYSRDTGPLYLIALPSLDPSPFPLFPSIFLPTPCHIIPFLWLLLRPPLGLLFFIFFPHGDILSKGLSCISPHPGL